MYIAYLYIYMHIYMYMYIYSYTYTKHIYNCEFDSVPASISGAYPSPRATGQNRRIPLPLPFLPGKVDTRPRIELAHTVWTFFALI